MVSGSHEPHFSASQVEAFLLCPLKWYFGWVKGIRTPPTKALTFGTQCHGELEGWWKTGDASLLKRKLTKYAAQFMPPPGSSLCYVERECRFPLYSGRIWVGRIDFLDLRRRRHPEITDHKTTKEVNYAKTPHELAISVQMTSYAQWLLQSTGLINPDEVEDITYRHICMVTHGDYRNIHRESDVFERVVSVTPDIVERAWKRVLLVCHSMDVVSRIKKAEKVELPGDFDGSACRAYGGCPHEDMCPRHKAAEWFSEDDVEKKPLRTGVIPPDAPDPYKHRSDAQGDLLGGAAQRPAHKLDAFAKKKKDHADMKAQAVDAEFVTPPPPPPAPPPAEAATPPGVSPDESTRKSRQGSTVDVDGRMVNCVVVGLSDKTFIARTEDGAVAGMGSSAELAKADLVVKTREWWKLRAEKAASHAAMASALRVVGPDGIVVEKLSLGMCKVTHAGRIFHIEAADAAKGLEIYLGMVRAATPDSVHPASAAPEKPPAAPQAAPEKPPAVPAAPEKPPAAPATPATPAAPQAVPQAAPEKPPAAPQAAPQAAPAEHKRHCQDCGAEWQVGDDDMPDVCKACGGQLVILKPTGRAKGGGRTSEGVADPTVVERFSIPVGSKVFAGVVRNPTPGLFVAKTDDGRFEVEGEKEEAVVERMKLVLRETTSTESTTDDRMKAAVATAREVDKVVKDPVRNPGPVLPSTAPTRMKGFTLMINCLPYRPLPVDAPVMYLEDYVDFLQREVISTHPSRAPDVRLGERGYEILAVAAEKHPPQCEILIATVGTLTANTVLEVLRKQAAQVWIGVR